jgi:hypothetical protein
MSTADHGDFVALVGFRRIMELILKCYMQTAFIEQKLESARSDL